MDQLKDGQESTFYMTMPPLMCEVVKSFLASEKAKVLNHPPYLPDWPESLRLLFISKA